MKVVLKNSAGAQIELDQSELLIINAALNEVCNGMRVFEFETRIGAARVEVDKLQIQIRNLIDGQK